MTSFSTLASNNQSVPAVPICGCSKTQYCFQKGNYIKPLFGLFFFFSLVVFAISCSPSLSLSLFFFSFFGKIFLSHTPFFLSQLPSTVPVNPFLSSSFFFFFLSITKRAMRVAHVVAGFSGPLLALSGQAAARNPANLEVTEVQKVTDEKEGTFRPFVEFALAGQSIRGLLDTGSSNWNVPRTGSKFCKGAGAQCDPTTTGFKAGSLDLAKAGKQVRDLKLTFNDSYTGGASFIGRFVEAPLQVSKRGKAVPVQIGLIEDGGVPEGAVSFPVLGVGPVDGEFVEKPYANVPARFKQAGKTKVNAFGLHIGDFRKYTYKPASTNPR